MPEGPEIWRTADRLNQALAGKELTECFFYHEKLKPYEEVLVGTRVKRVEPKAKALITYFDNDLCLYTHNQLYGKWFAEPFGGEPNTGRSLRVALHNDEHSALLYSASEIEIMDQQEVGDHPYLKKLGPDVVHPDTTAEMISAQYHDEVFQNRRLTTLLLDQGFLSGVGNYLRSEIMFYAGVDPYKKLRAYNDEEKEELAKASRLLARRSYETGGITNDPAIVDALKREKATRKEYRHFVYGRTGKFCHKCGTRIEEDKTGGRKIYYCPACQDPEVVIR